MEMKKGVLTLAIAGILALLMVLTASSALALGGPPPGEHFAGPGMIVEFEFSPDTECTPPESGPGAVYSATVSCKGETFEIIDNYSLCEVWTFEELNENTLHGYYPDPDGDVFPLPEWCSPRGSVDGYYLQSVISYSYDEANQIKKAKVIMLFVVPK